LSTRRDFQSTSPARVGILTSPPSTAVYKSNVTSEYKSSPLVQNENLGITSTTKYRSPLSPFGEAAPAPRTRILVPVRAPAGILPSKRVLSFAVELLSHCRHLVN
jgi:hypothetical protein